MTESKATTGAVSHNKTSWHSINWEKAHQIVRRLQMRIVKATQQGKWNKVKSLQYLLTRSFSAKAVAIKRVTENRGKKTAGVDGVIWNTPKKKFSAISQLQKRGYKPQPLKRIYIPKANNPAKKRPLSIPTMKDRAFQALYLLALDPIAETTADPNSYGFRLYRSTADAIEQCFRLLMNKGAAQWILDCDIQSCFDKISHKWILSHTSMDKTILRKWLKAGFIERGAIYPTIEGVPQGGVISPVICNMVLDSLEKKLKAKFGQTDNPRGRKNKVHLVRYCDDFIITGTSRELLENKVLPSLRAFLRARGLKLSKEKTRIVHIQEGFDFLGQNIRKYRNGKLLITPSKKNVISFLDKVRRTLKSLRQAPAEIVIGQLNPMIRGWANYHRFVVGSKTFKKVDSAIFWMLWRWAKRRHPHKSCYWIKKKYFPPKGNLSWVFSSDPRNPKSPSLFRASSLHIVRYSKIKATANPYDPKDEPYFEHKLKQKWLMGEYGKGRLRKLWLEQNGICPVCSQKITRETKWEIHHIIPKVKLGADCLSNLLLLHSNCHIQLHSQGLTVVKPSPARGF
jgi:RNA-directed DNA polymerase